MQIDTETDARHRWLALLTCAVATASVLLQYVLLVRLTLDTIGPAFATLRFFSYFTILSNILVALATGLAAFGGGSRAARWFRRGCVRGGVAVYIGVTGITYTAILRHVWQPQGLQWWVDSGLHYAVPVLYVLWWLLGAPHGDLRWRDLPRWLVFPLLYLLWCFVRGAWVQEYPYPFIDVIQLGWSQVLINACGVILLLLCVGSLVIVLDGVLGRTRERP